MLKLLPLAILLPYAAFSQTIPASPPAGSSPICLPVAQAAQVRDSLRMLPVVRREAAAWALAAGRYRAAADTARTAYFGQLRSLNGVQRALWEEKAASARQAGLVKQWQGKARRRGFWNWVTVVSVAALSGVFIPR